MAINVGSNKLHCFCIKVKEMNNSMLVALQSEMKDEDDRNFMIKLRDILRGSYQTDKEKLYQKEMNV